MFFNQTLPFPNLSKISLGQIFWPSFMKKCGLLSVNKANHDEAQQATHNGQKVITNAHHEHIALRWVKNGNHNLKVTDESKNSNRNVFLNLPVY